MNSVKKSNSLGVTILPVTVPSLAAFGSLEDVGSKILSAERAKESTINVTMLRQQERQATYGTVYDFVYELVSTRGVKRIVNAVSIVKSKLYIVNGTVGCGKGGGGCGEEQQQESDALLHAAQSLDVINTS